MKVVHLNWGFSKQSLKCVILAVFFVFLFFFYASYVVSSGTGTRKRENQAFLVASSVALRIKKKYCEDHTMQTTSFRWYLSVMIIIRNMEYSATIAF